MSKLRVSFINPPSLSKFDAAGARFQARRKADTLWYPAWLAYAAGLVETEFDVDLIDSPAEKIKLAQLVDRLRERKPQLIVIYTSTPSMPNDMNVCQEIKRHISDARIVLVGPHVTVLPEQTLASSTAVWGVARGEFEHTILELARATERAGAYENIMGLSWKNNGSIRHNPDRPLMENLDELPFVTAVYKKYLNPAHYYLGFALHPYVSIYSSRGCPSRCTYCLWPQTTSGHKLRVRTIKNVVAEMKYISEAFPGVKEIFFDDDTFTADQQRIQQICSLMKTEGINITWSANARANLDFALLKTMKQAGARLLVVGYESGNQGILNNVKKGITLSQAESFTRDAKRAGLMLHGTFIIGLPGETRETIRNTVRFAKKLDLDSVQFSVATPLPGTEFYKWCCDNGFLKESSARWLDDAGYQNSIVGYPELSAGEIVEAVDHATNSFYWRPRYFLTMLRQVIRDPREASRIGRAAPSFAKYSIQRWWQRKAGNRQ